MDLLTGLTMPDFPSFFSSYSLVMGPLLILLGLVVCFAGYKIFRVIIGLTGASFGFTVGMAIGSNFSNGELWMWVSAVLMALLLGILAFAFYLAGVFLSGLLLGSGVGYVAASTFGAGWSQGLIVLFFAVVGGTLAIMLQRPIIVLFTAFTGAWSVASGVTAYVDPGQNPLSYIASPSGAFPIAMLMVWFFLGIAGSLIQFRIFKPTLKGPPVTRKNYHVEVPKREHKPPEEEAVQAASEESSDKQ